MNDPKGRHEAADSERMKEFWAASAPRFVDLSPKKPEPVFFFTSGVTPLCPESLSPQGRMLLSVGRGPRTRLWELGCSAPGRPEDVAGLADEGISRFQQVALAFALLQVALLPNGGLASTFPFVLWRRLGRWCSRSRTKQEL